MNNWNFANGIPINCSALNSPNNSENSVPLSAFNPNAPTENLSLQPVFQPSYINYPQLANYYGYNGQAYPHLGPSINQLPVFTHNNQYLPPQVNPTLPFPTQPSGLGPIGQVQQLVPPCNIFGQEPVAFNSPRPDQFPIGHQMCATQPCPNMFSPTSPQELYPPQLLEPVTPLNSPNMFLPSIRHCISFAPIDERTNISSNNTSYQEVPTGILGVPLSTMIESQSHSNNINVNESHPPILENQAGQVSQTCGVSHVEVPCSIIEPNSNSVQLFEVNFNFSGIHQTCKVIFYLQNSPSGSNRNLTATISSVVNIDEVQTKEDQINNKSVEENSATHQDTDETVAQDSRAFTAFSETLHLAATPPSANEEQLSSSSEYSSSNEEFKENTISVAIGQKSSHENVKVEVNEENPQ